MNYDKQTAHTFYARAAVAAQLHAATATEMQITEEQVLLNLGSALGAVIDAHATNDATRFRRALSGLVALAAIAEQWTMDATDCECEDCTARAVAAERAKQESALDRDIQIATAQAVADLQMRDFYWVAPIEDNQGMIVTQNPEAYKTVQPGTWNRIRAVDYKSACVAAHEARNKLAKGN